MARRCTAEEWAVIPCDCVLIDCQADYTDDATAKSKVVMERFSNKEISLSEALEQLDEINIIRKMGYGLCVAEAKRCKGTEDLPIQPFTPRQKTEFRSSSRRSWRHAAVRVITYVAWKRAKPHSKWGGVAAAIGIMGTTLAYASERIREVAEDPPDADFTEVAEPIELSIDDVVPDGFPGDLGAEELTAWVTNCLEIVAVSDAMVTALNRAQGAEAAGDETARDQQLAAAHRFAGDWASLLVDGGPLRWCAALVLQSLGANDATLLAGDIYSAQRDVFSNGWPSEVLDILGGLGVEGEQRTAFVEKATSLLNQAPESVTTLIGLLVDDEVETLEAELADDLRAFALG
jgi:hypothetical protein